MKKKKKKPPTQCVVIDPKVKEKTRSHGVNWNITPSFFFKGSRVSGLQHVGIG